MTVELITSRDVMAELTRHRLASFCVESQRYVDGRDALRFIRPVELPNDPQAYALFQDHVARSLSAYQCLKAMGATNQDARKVLPNATATRLVMRANLREWRHIFALRTDKSAYPEMRALMETLLKKAQALIPVVFDDIGTASVREKGEHMHSETLRQMRDLYLRKNQDYGNSAHKTCLEFGIEALAVRVADKLSRLTSLMEKGKAQKVQGESIQDTLLDAANYLVMISGEAEWRRAQGDNAPPSAQAGDGNVPFVLNQMDLLPTISPGPSNKTVSGLTQQLPHLVASLKGGHWDIASSTAMAMAAGAVAMLEAKLLAKQEGEAHAPHQP